MTEQQRAVLALSVYNALSLTGRDQTIAEVVNFLRATWRPAFGEVWEVVTDETVRDAARTLVMLGEIILVVDYMKILDRDPNNARGRTLQLTQDWTGLVPIQHPAAAR